ncbi:DUF4303 domain-containing protein [Streptomyces termitum]|uniref:DUF4303 domain-containing protein n=1 Tax=Streptomyces termitum TaxID=67368 RepID=A0A918SRX1_9ACTN|nr:DUF4303 domain-containing protein [Streptomyces termitum]GHA65245.1 hypothetical protein GCM10010305_03620 [Streptomyces termitum]
MDTEIRAWARDWAGRLGPALEQAVAAVAGRLPADDVVGVGIATCADATAIVAFAHSRRHLDTMTAREPEFALDAKWHLGEWDVDIAGADDPLEPVRAEADRARRHFGGSDAGLHAFRQAVWDSIAQALAESAARGFFTRWPHAVRVFLPLDADLPEADLARWNAPLNDPAGTTEFRKFLQLEAG